MLNNQWSLLRSKNGKYFYEHKNGIISEEYNVATVYSNGFGLVELDNGRKAYRDVYGNLSEEYLDASSYLSGFAKIRLTNGKYALRDILGNVSEKTTKVGEEAIKYYLGQIDEYELSDEAYLDDNFLKYIMQRTKAMVEQSLELAENEEQVSQVREVCGDLIEYIKERTLDAYMNEKQKALQNSELNNLKKLAEEELYF